MPGWQECARAAPGDAGEPGARSPTRPASRAEVVMVAKVPESCCFEFLAPRSVRVRRQIENVARVGVETISLGAEAGGARLSPAAALPQGAGSRNTRASFRIRCCCGWGQRSEVSCSDGRIT